MIKWLVKLYARFYVFFSKSENMTFLRFFELLHTFSRTLDVANKSRGNRACRTCRTRMLRRCPQQVVRVGRVNEDPREDVTRMLGGKRYRGI